MKDHGGSGVYGPEAVVTRTRNGSLTSTGSTAGNSFTNNSTALFEIMSASMRANSDRAWQASLAREAMLEQIRLLGIAIADQKMGVASKQAAALGDANKEVNWYGTGGQVNWSLSMTGAILENVPGSLRLTRGGNVSLKYYASGWRGGGRGGINTYNIGRIGKGLGYAAVFVAVIMDGIGVYNYYENPNSPNAISPGKAFLNTGMSGLGFTGVGTIPSLMYFGIDAFYPGGAQGYMSDYSDIIYRNPEYYPRFSF